MNMQTGFLFLRCGTFRGKFPTQLFVEGVVAQSRQTAAGFRLDKKAVEPQLERLPATLLPES